MGDGEANFGIKKGFLSQSFKPTSDKVVRLRNEKKLKCPSSLRDEHPSHVNQENAIFNFLSELE